MTHIIYKKNYIIFLIHGDGSLKIKTVFITGLLVEKWKIKNDSDSDSYSDSDSDSDSDILEYNIMTVNNKNLFLNIMEYYLLLLNIIEYYWILLNIIE